MPAINISNEEKVQMLIGYNDGGTLTEIAKDFEVSRKTVRRRIDEVLGFYSRINVGDKIPHMADHGIVTVTVIEKDNPIFDTVPVLVEFEDGSRDYVLLHELIDAAEREETANRITAEVEAEIEEVADMVISKLKVGDRVRIHPSSEFYGFSNTVNPLDCTGTVVEVDRDSDLTIRVDWDNGSSNVYNNIDLYIHEEEESVEEEENAQYFVTAPQDSLTIIRIDQDTGEVTQRQTNKHNENFVSLRNAIKLDQSQETLREIYNALDTTRMLESYSVGRVKVNPETETVVFVKPNGNERDVPDDIAMDIITTVREYGREESDRLVKFLDRLMDNVSFKAIEGLYRFMKHNCIEINEDGSIKAWKGVRPDLYSCSAGKIKSSETVEVKDGRIYNGYFGVEVRVDRSEVDDDPDSTCSYGLHVGNRSYADGFGQTLLAVTVEPQDVVAVPKDYNGDKMRCCAYKPLYVV